MSTEPETVDNPYVGPRTFTSRQAKYFYGREREARDLLARVLSERLVLFYAQSGAGKSSLINTRLVPGLREVGYAVLPVVRVGGEPPAGTGEVGNIFLFNLMLGLAEGDPNPARFAKLKLCNFLDGLSTEDGEHYVYEGPDPAAESRAADGRAADGRAADGPKEECKPAAPGEAEAALPQGEPAAVHPYVLIIDQFEELITTHLDRWKERAEFFRQLDAAMRHDPNLWVVLSMREDFVAPVEAYAPLLADRMRARFYMERMGVAAALDAIRKPAALEGRPFDPDVADELVIDLRQVRVPGQDEPIPGQYVEPVQLQVVCHQLWENIKGRPPGPITLKDLQDAGDVDRALILFYEETLRAALAEPGVELSERRLRTWFDKELITPSGTRGLVRQGETMTGSLPNGAIGPLQRRFLVRAEARSGDTWIELVHDRFVEPILESNRDWFSHKQDPLTKAAQAWQNGGRPKELLYAGSQLASATAQLAADPAEYGELEQEFVEESQKREDKRVSSRTRWIASAAFVLALLFIVLAALAFFGMQAARVQARKAGVAQQAAEEARGTAEARGTVLAQARAEAEDKRAKADAFAEQARVAAATADYLRGQEGSLRADAEAKRATAVAAQATADADRVIAYLALEKADSQRRAAVATQGILVAQLTQAADSGTAQAQIALFPLQTPVAFLLPIPTPLMVGQGSQAPIASPASTPALPATLAPGTSGQGTEEPTVSPTGTPAPAPPRQFVQRAGRDLVLGDRRFRFIGVNLRGLAHYGQSPGLPFADARQQLRAARDMGARAVRLILPHREVNADETAARLRDLLDLMKAEFPDMYLTIALGNEWGDTDFRVPGDEAFYAPSANFQQALTPEWFAGGYKQNYLPFVERIVREFRNEPQIMSWEIGNEFKVDQQPDLLVTFMHDMADRIKAIDPNHLVTTGMISTRHAWMAGNDELRVKLYGSPNIDFITNHAYRDDPATPSREDDSDLAARLRMPLVISEAGQLGWRGTDRSEALQNDLQLWLDEKAVSGYLQWGFMAGGDNGDGDSALGMDQVWHSADWDAFNTIYRERAQALAQDNRVIRR